MAQVPALLDASGRPIERAEKQDIGWGLPVTGGWLPPAAGNLWNWWQCGYDPLSLTGSATVQACISCYAQTVAMCPGTHWRRKEGGGRERVRTSPLTRILKAPNSYQSISDFLLNLTSELYEEGNAYAVARRDNRFQIYELHLMKSRMSGPRIAQDGSLFYHLGGNEIAEKIFGFEALSAIPSRDVLHLRLNTRRDMLTGEAPLMAALTEIAASNALVAQTLAFVNNRSRPSGIAQTDLPLNEQQSQQLRDRINNVTQGMNAGGVPVFSHGLKWQSISVTSRDAQLAEILQISDQRIASVYRVPLALLSLFSSGAVQATTESLMRNWIATGLGFVLNHIEEAIGRLFGLAGWPDEYLELDTNALERSNFKDRIEALSRGVISGVYAPNEARDIEELPPTVAGDEPRVQQQVVPLSAWNQVQPQTPRPDAPPPAPPADPAADLATNNQGRVNVESVVRAFRAARDRAIAA